MNELEALLTEIRNAIRESGLERDLKIERSCDGHLTASLNGRTYEGNDPEMMALIEALTSAAQ